MKGVREGLPEGLKAVLTGGKGSASGSRSAEMPELVSVSRFVDVR